MAYALFQIRDQIFAGLDGWLAGRGWLPARVALYGWLGLFAGALFLSYAA